MKEKDLKAVFIKILGYSPLLTTVMFILSVIWFFIKIVIPSVRNNLSYSEVTLLLYTTLMLALLALLVNLIVFLVMKTLNLLKIEEKRAENTSEFFNLLTLILPIVRAFIRKKKTEEKKKS